MRERFEQFRQSWQLASAANPRMPWYVLGTAAAIIAIAVAVSMLLGTWLYLPIGVLLAALAAMVIFGRQAQSAQYAQIEGRPGAAAAVLDVLRGQWLVTPAVGFTKKQDFVHRVVGRPGVILVAEGKRTRLKAVVSKEHRRMNRLVGDDTPVHLVTVGDGDGEVPLDKLHRKLNKLPRKLGKKDVPKLARELDALDPGMPMPKGHIPNPGKKMR